MHKKVMYKGCLLYNFNGETCSIEFRFRSESGNSMHLIYSAKQIKSFVGVMHHFDKFFEDEGCIVLKDSTKELMKQIMEFHKYNAIDKCLDNKDFIMISELQK